MWKATLCCLLSLAQLFVQTYAETFVQSTPVLDKNSTGPQELKLEHGKYGKPFPNFPKYILPFHPFDSDTNPHRCNCANYQSETVQPTQINDAKSVSRTSHLVLGNKMLYTTYTIPSKTTAKSGREQLDVALSPYGTGPAFERSLNDAHEFNALDADVKMEVMGARFSGEKVKGKKCFTTCSKLEVRRNHRPDVEKQENQKLVDETKTILSIDEDVCTFDLTSENQKNINIELNEKFINCVDFQFQFKKARERLDDTEVCDRGAAVTELENSSNDVCKCYSLNDDAKMEAKVVETVSNVCVLYFIFCI